MKPNNYNVGEPHLLWMHDELLSLSWAQLIKTRWCLVAPSANVKSEMTWPGCLEGWWGSRVTGLQRCFLPYTAQLCQFWPQKSYNTTLGQLNQDYRGTSDDGCVCVHFTPELRPSHCTGELSWCCCYNDRQIMGSGHTFEWCLGHHIQWCWCVYFVSF